MSGRDRATAVSVLVLGLALCSGCAAALREPPTVEAMADAATASTPDAVAVEARALLERAARSFALRTPQAARRAAADGLRAATLEPDAVEGLLEAARARVWLAAREPTDEARRATALGAVQAAQRCARRAPSDPRCDYWLAVALGVQARERRATALDALPTMIELLERAIDRAPAIEMAGPDRVLALVLVRAPGWPSGPGDPDRGLEHAERAAAIAPHHPPNRLALAEALAAVGRHGESRAEYLRARELARGALSRGEPDAGEWLDEAIIHVSR